MHIGFKHKPYGLNERKPKPPPSKTPLFNSASSDSDSEDENPKNTNQQKVRALTNKELMKLAYSKKTEEQVKKQQEEALQLDPTIFQYDEVIDSIKEKTTTKKIKQEKAQDQSKKPKYIEAFLQSAKEREKLHELAFEKKLLREQNEDFDKFGNKERFMTESYKQHLVQLRKWEDEQNQKEAKNADYSKRIDNIDNLSTSDKEKVRQHLNNQFSINFYKNIFSSSGRYHEEERDSPEKDEGVGKTLELQKEPKTDIKPDQRKRKNQEMEEDIESVDKDEDKGQSLPKGNEIPKSKQEGEDNVGDDQEDKSKEKGKEAETEKDKNQEEKEEKEKKVVDTKKGEVVINEARRRFLERKKQRLQES